MPPFRHFNKIFMQKKSTNFGQRVLLTDNEEGDIEAIDHKRETITQMPFVDCLFWCDSQAKNVHANRVIYCGAISRLDLTKTNRITKIMLHQCWDDCIRSGIKLFFRWWFVGPSKCYISVLVGNNFREEYIIVSGLSKFSGRFRGLVRLS